MRFGGLCERFRMGIALALCAAILGAALMMHSATAGSGLVHGAQAHLTSHTMTTQIPARLMSGRGPHQMELGLVEVPVPNRSNEHSGHSSLADCFLSLIAVMAAIRLGIWVFGRRGQIQLYSAVSVANAALTDTVHRAVAGPLRPPDLAELCISRR